MKLDAQAAETALAALAEKIGLKDEKRAVRAAEAALRVVSAMMSTELYKGLARRGEDPREFSLMAFGGAGPTHANLLAEESRISSIVVPPAPGTFCAMGAILADVKRDYVRSWHLKFADGPAAIEELARVFRELETDAATWIETEGDLLGEPIFEAALDMRYEGQAFDLQVMIPDALRVEPDIEGITKLFHAEHERIYSFRDLESNVEVTTERVRVTGKNPPIAFPEVAARKATPPVSRRRVFHRGTYHDVPVFPRRELGRDAAIVGPAIIEQEDSTIWIMPDWTARVDRIGNIVIVAA